MTEQEVYKKNRYKLVTMIGFILSLIFFFCKREEYKLVTIIMVPSWVPAAISLGLYIFIPKDMYYKRIKQHEYGHVIQLAMYGNIKFIKNVGIPSLISATFDKKNHKNKWYELEADRLGGVEK